jgi:8-oxo-dGTP pyrophosphatase MutT (NUDIX family)
VTIWHEGKILLVQNSYLNYMSLPGGHVNQGESAVQAAVRELREEIGLDVVQQDLSQVLDHTHQWEGRSDHVEFFELDVSEPPAIKIDNREVVSAKWFTPEEALRLDLFPPLRQVIENKRTQARS